LAPKKKQTIDKDLSATMELVYKLPEGITLETPVNSSRTVKEAFDAIVNWDVENIRSRLVSDQAIPPDQINEAIMEFRKFLMCVVMSRAMKVGGVGMMSKLIDEVWHQAILFTREYFALSEALLGSGQYLHHAPNMLSGDTSSTSSADNFTAIYEALFGQIPAIWGVRYSGINDRIWENSMQGTCFTIDQLNCEAVCKPGVPCEPGQLCDSIVLHNSSQQHINCQAVCVPSAPCSEPGQLCDTSVTCSDDYAPIKATCALGPACFSCGNAE
jgi:hypothetical protein